MLGACLGGANIAQVMAFGCEALLRRGELVELFPDWLDETFPLCAYHLSRRQQPAKIRACIAFCLELASAIHKRNS